MKPTTIEDLRRPHPDQKRIDAQSAALLRATALDIFRHRQLATELPVKAASAANAPQVLTR